MKINYGECCCGCGNKTKPHTRTQKRLGIKIGDPRQYVYGHVHIERIKKQDYKINKTTGCWEWQKAKSVCGYGQLREVGKTIKAHRYYYEKYNGKIPAGMFVCHTCDNPPCVNPKHLFLGTAQDNMRDMVKKKRNADTSGEKNGRAKLTLAQVKNIRKEYKYYSIKNGSVALAKKYGVSQSVISGIIKRVIWNKW